MREESLLKIYRSSKEIPEDRWIHENGKSYENPRSIKAFKNRLVCSHISESQLDKTFDNFEVNDDNKDIFEVFKNWSFEQNGICIGGKAGTGKSHLCIALAVKLIEMGRDVYFIRSVTFLEDLMRMKSSQYDEERMKYVNLMKRLKTIEVLMIDDLGAEKMSESKETALFEILDDRVINKQNLRTFITTNLNWNEVFERFHERIGDRIQEVCLLRKAKGESFRKILRDRNEFITKKTQS